MTGRSVAAPRGALVALAVLVAGCLGGTDAGPAVDEGPVAPVATFSRDTGGILGLVTDVSLLPLGGVRVVLDDGQEARSHADGTFAFSHLAPRTYALTASLAGHYEETVPVAVEAGRLAEPQVTLEPMPSDAPYATTYLDSVVLRCGFTWNAPLPAPLGYGNVGCDWVSLVAGENPLDEGVGSFHVPDFETVVGVWLETAWTPSQFLASEAEMLWLVRVDGNPTQTGVGLAYLRGNSYAGGPLAREQVDERIEGHDGAACGPDRCTFLVQHRAFRQGDGATLTLEQRFDSYLTAFHHGRLPADFSAIPEA